VGYSNVVADGNPGITPVRTFRAYPACGNHLRHSFCGVRRLIPVHSTYRQRCAVQRGAMNMLINVGPSNEPSDIVGLLAACHDRIRFFIDLAVGLATTTGISDDMKRNSRRLTAYPREFPSKPRRQSDRRKFRMSCFCEGLSTN